MDEKQDQRVYSKQDGTPSLRPENAPHGPHAWVQWKGTNVCMDIRCACGAMHHLDAEFAYYVKCGECGQVYECDGHIRLHRLDYEPEQCVHVLEDPWNV